MSRSAHPAGPRHGDVLPEDTPPPRRPTSTRSTRPIWPALGRTVGGVLQLGGAPVTELVAEHGTPALFLDEEDLRARARAYRAAFADLDVYYAGKAFLCTTVARWVAEEGLGLDVCTGGELAVALAAGFPAERIALHGNNKSTAELRRAVDVGVGHVIVDSFDEIDRLAAVAADRRGRPAGAGAGHRRRRGAHPRVHRHRARGPEVRLLAARRRGRRARWPPCWPPVAGAGRAALAHRLADLRDRRLRGGRAPRGRAGRADPRRARRGARGDQPRRRPGHRLRLGRRSGDAEADPRAAGRASSSRSAPPAGCGARGCRWSPAAPSSGRAPSPSTRSARSSRSPWTAGWCAPTSRSTAG